MELIETMAALQESYKKLPSKDHGFALSLIQQYSDKSNLSSKQQHWAEKLLAWSTGVPTPKKEMTVVGDFSGVYALFATAKEHLKYPKIKLNSQSALVMLALAGSKSKLPGVVNVTDGGKYGENVWYGRVYPDGKFEANSTVNSGVLDSVGHLLKELSADPAGVVSEYGKLTGKCSFCDASLSYQNSTAVGYGPVCAKHFGLYDQWKAAAKAAGLSDTEINAAYTVQMIKDQGKAPASKKSKKPVVFAPKQKSTLTVQLEKKDGVIVKAEEIITQTMADAVVIPARNKKTLVVSKEKDEYLF